MILQYMGPGPYHEYEQNGNVLTILGTDYDLDVLQKDSIELINIEKDGCFAVTIEIPPEQYEEVESDGDFILVKKPVEMGRVKLVLWTI